MDEQEETSKKESEDESISPPPVKEGVPIRWQH